MKGNSTVSGVAIVSELFAVEYLVVNLAIFVRVREWTIKF
jgi:hypothetical protein